MASIRDLFYSEKYDKVQQALDSVPEQSISQQHNSTIIKYLKDGQNPLPSLLSLANKIREQTNTESPWVIHPSWALINYHIALYYYQHCQYEEAFAVVNSIWKNAKLVDQNTLIFVSVLTFELSISTKNWENASAALEFFAELRKDKAKFSSTLKKFFEKSPHSAEIVDMIEKIQFKVNTALNIAKGNEKKTELESNLKKAVNIQKLTMGQVLPLLSTAWHLHDIQKFERILEIAPNQSDLSITNNRGVLEITQGKYSSALLHFSKALGARKTSEIIQPYNKILYNIGVSLLFKNKPTKASEILHMIVPTMPKFPYLWLRLAECSVMYYKQRVANLRTQKQLSQVIYRRISTATNTYTILPPSSAKLFAKYSSEKDYEGPELSLEYAQKCADNAIRFSSPNQEKIKVSAELISTYVSLELNEPQRALDHVVQITNSSVNDRFAQLTANIYHSQALILMGEPGPAKTMLNSKILEYKLGAPTDPEMYGITFEQALLLSPKQERSKDNEKYQNHTEIIITRAMRAKRDGHDQEAIKIINQFTPKNE